MLASSIPVKISVPFASGASGSFVRTIPIPSQINTDPGAASFTDGFVPLNGTPVAAGGIPPDERDMNGILLAITQWDQWANAGGPMFYDSAFATAIGGYPQGAILMSAVVPGNYWLSTADNNTTNPDSTSAANWVPDPSRIAPGTPVPSFSSTVPTGFVACNTLTIGNAASNGTGRANADTLLAYRAIWTQFSNTACPIFTSAGGASTRGANPDADFAANKALATPDLRGRGLIGVDTMGGPSTTRLAGVPFTLGGLTNTGSILGENLHSLVEGENGPHSHGGTTGLMNSGDPHTHSVSGGILGSNGSLSGTGTGATSALNGATTIAIVNASVNHNHNIPSDGSGTAHNTVSQSVSVFWNLKL